MKIRPANEQDLAELSGWFLTESEVKNWGGPSIHFPLSLEQLKIDIEWDVAQSYALVATGLRGSPHGKSPNPIPDQIRVEVES